MLIIEVGSSGKCEGGDIFLSLDPSHNAPLPVTLPSQHSLIRNTLAKANNNGSGTQVRRLAGQGP